VCFSSICTGRDITGPGAVAGAAGAAQGPRVYGALFLGPVFADQQLALSSREFAMQTV
jgi:hypothetical protein